MQQTDIYRFFPANAQTKARMFNGLTKPLIKSLTFLLLGIQSLQG